MDKIASCSFLNEDQDVLEVLEFKVHEIRFYEGKENQTIGDYYIDCNDPTSRWSHVTLRLADGGVFGKHLQILPMETELKGKVGACSQPLHTNRDWVADWVAHYASVGVSKIIMHAPQGPQVDDLFNENRDSRINFNSDLDERTPQHVGTERLKKIEHPKAEWFDYWPSPRSLYYGEQFIFTICQYRLRYEFEYVVNFDIDEFWANGIEVGGPADLPGFLDKYFQPKSATIAFYQCPTSTDGEYTSRFTRGDDRPGNEKVAVRPRAAENMHVHNILDATEEWIKEVGPDWRLYLDHVRPSLAYLKHIRPSKHVLEDGTITHNYKCHGHV